MASDAVYLRDLDGTGSLHVCSDGGPGAIEHIPTTQALAMVAAEREAIASLVQSSGGIASGHLLEKVRIDTLPLASAIRARTPDDAQAALDALLKAERVKARAQGHAEAVAWLKAQNWNDTFLQSTDYLSGEMDAALKYAVEKETGQ